MSNIFSIDSPVMRVLATVADVMLLNVLFLATSVPIVTLGASTTALHGTALRLVTGRCHDGVIKTYFREFRSNFGRGTVLGLITLGLAVVLWAWYVVITNFAIPGPLKLVLLGVLVVITLRVFGTVVFMFGYQATFDDKLGTVIGNARKLSGRHPVATLQTVAQTIIPVIVSIYYPQMVLWGLLWLALGFGAIAALNAFALARVFRRYGLPAADDVPTDG